MLRTECVVLSTSTLTYTSTADIESEIATLEALADNVPGIDIAIWFNCGGGWGGNVFVSF